MPTQYLHSLAHLATLAETPVSEVQRILTQSGAMPTVVIDLCPYYSGEVAATVVCRARGWTNQPAYHRTFRNDEVCT